MLDKIVDIKRMQNTVEYYSISKESPYRIHYIDGCLYYIYLYIDNNFIKFEPFSTDEGIKLRIHHPPNTDNKYSIVYTAKPILFMQEFNNEIYNNDVLIVGKLINILKLCYCGIGDDVENEINKIINGSAKRAINEDKQI